MLRCFSLFVAWTAGQDAHSSGCCIPTAVAVLRGNVAAAVSEAKSSCGLPPITVMIRPAALNLWVPRHRLTTKPARQPGQYRQDKSKYLRPHCSVACCQPGLGPGCISAVACSGLPLCCGIHASACACYVLHKQAWLLGKSLLLSLAVHWSCVVGACSVGIAYWVN